MEEEWDFNILPEGCVSKILSLTSPKDACRSSLVSSTFRSAVESDIVWETFLPSDYREIVSNSITPLKFSSKKELFFLLCDSILIDGGSKNFKLEKSSGKISYTLSARDLSIANSEVPVCWSWKPLPQSRFSEVVDLITTWDLITTCWLEIHGKIKTKKLSPNTTYAAYLVIKISDRSYGLDSIASEMFVKLGSQDCSGIAYLRQNNNKKQQIECLFYANRMQMLSLRLIEGDGRVASERDDGWMEIELGEFFNGEGDEEEVKMSLMEVKSEHLKGGLIIEGIEVRPKHTL